MHLIHLELGIFELPRVVDHVVRDCDLVFQWELRLDARSRGFRVDHVPRHQPLELNLGFSGDDHQRRKCSMDPIFDEQRSFVNQVGDIGLGELGDALLAEGRNPRVENRVELAACVGIGKHPVAEALAVQVSRVVNDLGAERLDHLGKSFRAGEHDFARKLVCIDDRDAFVREHPGDGAFSARDAACKSDRGDHGQGGTRGLDRRQNDWYSRGHMRAVAQRVTEAEVVVDGEIVGRIGRGLLVYLGAGQGDGDKDVDYMARKLVGLRIFPDDDDRMSRSVQDVDGGMLIVSQFTLFGDVRKGRRPSFDAACEPELARTLVQQVCDRVVELGTPVETGRFRASMSVRGAVDGPVTILVDSRKEF